MTDLFNNIKYWLWEVTKILGLVVAVAILVAILFGPNAPFLGGILGNVEGVVTALGSEGLGVIIALLIILSVWNSRSS
ncbi:MAG TPA: hypothetical protein EYF97_05475 [Gammaproteobacteria bacterium]|jgi:hypothetical protein|nr:hypothetical protein [Gammaproteobacteria bacterium]HIK72707.1 hypothetical protein [Gammaproteobacteria bacterium]